jgi:hypothetical protein
MRRYDVWLDDTRLDYLRQYVKQESSPGVSTTIRVAIDKLLAGYFADYQPGPPLKRGRKPRSAKPLSV